MPGASDFHKLDASRQLVILQRDRAIQLRDQLGGFSEVVLDTRTGRHWFMVGRDGFDLRIEVEIQDPR